jgi:metal-dependent amidase/aminoacylase/carboxypeptidase family protein
VQGVGTFAANNPAQQAPQGFIMVQLFPDRGQQASSREAVVQGQIMTAGPADRDRARASVLEAIEGLDFSGVTIETEYDTRFLDGVTNDSTLVEESNAAISALAPDVTVHEVTGIVPFFSEDFGSFQALVPGVMYFIGVNNPQTGTVGMPHNPGYVADDAAILVGVRVMLSAMLTNLR